jgi:arylsulfatase A-like enzyme
MNRRDFIRMTATGVLAAGIPQLGWAGEPEPSIPTKWTDEQWRMHRWAYARLTESVDAQIGQVLAALREAGLDLIPTMCDFAGIPVPEKLKGRSVRPLAEGKETASWRETLVTESEGARMLRSARYKYVRYSAGSEQLMDLEVDPGEMINLAKDPKSAPVLEEHRRLLKEWQNATKDTLLRVKKEERHERI